MEWTLRGACGQKQIRGMWEGFVSDRSPTVRLIYSARGPMMVQPDTAMITRTPAARKRRVIARREIVA